VQSKIVLGENIAQTAQFVETGNVDAGIVALSLVLSPKLKGVGRYYEIPSALYPRLEQAAVITKKGASNAAAAEYLAFLKSPAARSVFDAYGFILPK
ncbi:MAG TPA: molybdate ABC transporter substrate-binding protein, partial [Opitutaceae bacterium]|nr:molybdate ABC transporter substrate-binding protein [Opitutaceae bacterium]